MNQLNNFPTSVDSTKAVHPGFLQEGGGSMPTSTLQKSDWRVWDADFTKAHRFIEEHHYARGAANTAAHLHGLYRKSDFLLSGIAWWIPPTRDAAASFYERPDSVLALSRLALAPWVPTNGATYFLMQSVRRLDPRWECLVTYADTFKGHTGGIYKAAGWEYLGMTKPERMYLVDGRMTSRKAGPKTRNHAQMVALGAEIVGRFSKHRFRLIRKSPGKSQAREFQCELF